MKKLLLGGLILVSAGAMPSRAGAASDPGQSSADERRVCRTSSSVGTRLRERICMTRGQWRERERNQSREAKDLVDREADGRNTEFRPGDTPLR